MTDDVVYCTVSKSASIEIVDLCLVGDLPVTIATGKLRGNWSNVIWAYTFPYAV